MPNSSSITLTERFFSPISKALKNAKSTRYCSRYSDETHIESGLRRVLENVSSGREWVQQLQGKFGIFVSVRNFFVSLKSERRMNLLKEINQDVCRQTDTLLLAHKDLFSQHSELNKFALYASDGHTHGASAHELPIEGKKRPITNLFAMNLRTQSMSHLELAVPRIGKKQEHEISTLKRIGGAAMRMGHPAGVKVIHAYDPAVIDYKQWQKWKQGSGVYIITLEKKNSALEPFFYTSNIDTDPRNTGILSDEKLIATNEILVRRIKYEDPISGKIYSFITSEMTLPPGLIVFIYKMRWNIEKVFDEIKNKMMERKAWANSSQAKKQQAAFICIAHNLMLILECYLEIEEGISDEKSKQKRKKRLEQDLKRATDAGRTMNPLVMQYINPSQRSCQFIRWLRNCLRLNTCWCDAVHLIRPLMKQYLH
jgi:hypothetical protein